MCLSMETNLFNLHMNMGLQLSSLWTRLNSIIFLNPDSIQPIGSKFISAGYPKYHTNSSIFVRSFTTVCGGGSSSLKF